MSGGGGRSGWGEVPSSHPAPGEEGDTGGGSCFQVEGQREAPWREEGRVPVQDSEEADPARQEGNSLLQSV